MWQLYPADELIGHLWVSLLINILVALVEELAFRAYLLTGLKDAWGKSIGLVVMAVAFSLMHAPALDGYSLFSTACAFLTIFSFGLLFGWTYLRTGSLWLPFGIHFAWDFVESDLLNLSGDVSNPHLIGFVTRLTGPFSFDWLGKALFLDTLALIILWIGVWLYLSHHWVQRQSSIANDTSA